ncbi:MAG: hypothetical protein IIA45_03110 [Bacteroidetes bacterium]|nr:hypothetical protein [Bacteroidota bacterium]
MEQRKNNIPPDNLPIGLPNENDGIQQRKKKLRIKLKFQIDKDEELENHDQICEYFISRFGIGMFKFYLKRERKIYKNRMKSRS